MFKKLRTVIYHVNDLSTAKEWYIKATGIEPYFDEPFYIGFDINGYELGLDPDSATIVAGNQTISYWQVDDVAKTIDHLLSLKGILIQPKTNVGGDINVAIVSDPFGNHIGLIEGA
jgi:predicted enzyme related to lactoylglutathione lyase